jgi:hypothetical protein
MRCQVRCAPVSVAQLWLAVLRALYVACSGGCVCPCKRRRPLHDTRCRCCAGRRQPGHGLAAHHALRHRRGLPGTGCGPCVPGGLLFILPPARRSLAGLADSILDAGAVAVEAPHTPFGQAGVLWRYRRVARGGCVVSKSCPLPPPPLQDLGGPQALNLNASLTGQYRDIVGLFLFGSQNFNTNCSTSATFAGAVRRVILAAGNLPQGRGVSVNTHTHVCMCVHVCMRTRSCACVCCVCVSSAIGHCRVHQIAACCTARSSCCRPASPSPHFPFCTLLCRWVHRPSLLRSRSRQGVCPHSGLGQ